MSTLQSFEDFAIFANPDIEEGTTKVSESAFKYIFGDSVKPESISGTRSVFIHIRPSIITTKNRYCKIIRLKVSSDVLKIDNNKRVIFSSPLDLSNIGGLDLDGDIVEVFTIDGGNI